MDAISTGLIKIIIEDPGTASKPSSSGGSFTPKATTPASTPGPGPAQAAPPASMVGPGPMLTPRPIPRPVPPAEPRDRFRPDIGPDPSPFRPVPSVGPPIPAREQMVREIVSMPGAAKSGLTEQSLARVPEDMLADLHRKIRDAFPSPVAPPALAPNPLHIAGPTAKLHPEPLRPAPQPTVAPAPTPAVVQPSRSILEPAVARTPAPRPTASPPIPTPDTGRRREPEGQDVQVQPDRWTAAGEQIAKSFLARITPASLRPLLQPLFESFRVTTPKPAGPPPAPLMLQPTPAVPTPKPPQPDPAPRPDLSPETYAFADKADRVTAGPTFGVKPAEAAPSTPPRLDGKVLPQARPVEPAPRLAGPPPMPTPKPAPRPIPAEGPHAAGAAGGAAAGASGALASVAAVAGPVAIGLLAAEMASRRLTERFDTFTRRVEGAGQAVAKLSANDHMGLFNDAVDSAKAGLEEIPLAGKTAAAALGATVAPIKAVHTAMTALVARGKDLSSYSGSLAGANARADVRSLMGDMREAQQLGPALARLTDAQSKADSELQELLLPLKEVLAHGLASGMEVVASVLVELKSIKSQISEEVLALLENIVNVAGKRGDEGTDLVESFRKRWRMEDERAKREREGPIVDWLKAADNLGRDPGWDRQFSNTDNAAQRAVAGPMFPGFGDVLGL